MPVVQTFEETLDTDERLAALAAAMNRLPAEAVVRRLTPADAATSRVAPADRPASTIRPETGSAPLPAELSPSPARQPLATPPSPNPDANPSRFSPSYPPHPHPSSPSRRTLGAATVAAIPDPGTIPDPDAVPVPEPLAGLLPGGLRRGEAAALATRNQGPDYLALALLAEALKAGLWCAVIGVPELGLAALAGLLGPAAQRQAALDRLVLVAEPGEQWAEITATLADGVDLLLARPATPVRAETAQRVDARLRQGRSAGTRHSAALLVLGGWPTARLALRIARTDWTGLDGIGPTAGTGHLTAGRATVVAQGRATAGRPRVARLWLPDATGAVSSLSDNPGIVPGRPSQIGTDAQPALEPTVAAPSLTLVPAAPTAASPAAMAPASSSTPDTTTASFASPVPATPTPASPAA